MCNICNCAFEAAFRAMSQPSRRQFLQGAGALAASGPFIAEAVAPDQARADGETNRFLLRGLGADQGEVLTEPATVYTAKKIITMERRAPSATAVAVSGKRILAAGSLAKVKSALGDRPYRLDETFKAKIVMPGFIQQHLHPSASVMLTTDVITPDEWVLPGKTFKAASDPSQYWERLRAAEKRLTDPNAWLHSWGYHPIWHGKLDRSALDALNPTRPIAVWHRSGHAMHLNSGALEAMGLTEAAAKAATDQIDWNAGYFWENGMTWVAPPYFKALMTAERLMEGFNFFISYLHANGITAFQEPGGIFVPAFWKLVEQTFGAPDTPMYGTFLETTLNYPRGMDAHALLDRTEKQIAMAPEQAGKRVAILAKKIKLFLDGAFLEQLGQMKDSYTDGHQGQWITPPDEFDKQFKAYWDAGYQIHVHVNGDLGAETLIDVLDRRMRENPRMDHRTVFVHFGNSTEAQMARVKRLGAIVSMNPYYVFFADKFAKVGLGPERAAVVARAKSALRNKIPFSYHSDTPISPAAPLFLAWCGVNRISESGRVAGPEQRITVDQALRAITIEAAYSWGKEHEIGSIAPGKIANFTVLEEDPYAVPKIKLKDVPVWGTVFEGRVFPVQTALKQAGSTATSGRANSR